MIAKNVLQSVRLLAARPLSDGQLVFLLSRVKVEVLVTNASVVSESRLAIIYKELHCWIFRRGRLAECCQ